jgi:hypothetical protein
MNFITRAQALGKKAAELSQAVQTLPAKAAQIREAVTMTGGELKQLRTDVQSSLHGLRADSEDRLLSSMREINDHAALFKEAGYELFGMDLDLALNQRLAVHLEKVQDVSQATVRALLSRENSETIRSVLSGIAKAEETAANVELSQLVYGGLLIHIGALPMIRMCWRNVLSEAEESQPELPSPTIAAAPPAPPPNTSMFDLRPLPSGAVRIQPQPGLSAPPPLATPHPAVSASAAGGAWSQDALARFKQMPGASKYGR